MTDHTMANEAIRDIRLFAERRLREEFPYMKTARLDKMLDEAAKGFERDVAEQDPEMRPTMARTSFFSLSAELRNIIYEFALQEKDAIEINSMSPGLLMANKQVRNEALPIFCSINTFWTEIKLSYTVQSWKLAPKSGVDRLDKWISQVGRERAAVVRAIELRVTYNWSAEKFLRNGWLGVVKAWRTLGAHELLRISELPVREFLVEALGVANSGIPATTFKVMYGSKKDGLVELLSAMKGVEVTTKIGELKEIKEWHRWLLSLPELNGGIGNGSRKKS